DLQIFLLERTGLILGERLGCGHRKDRRERGRRRDSADAGEKLPTPRFQAAQDRALDRTLDETFDSLHRHPLGCVRTLRVWRASLTARARRQRRAWLRSKARDMPAALPVCARVATRTCADRGWDELLAEWAGAFDCPRSGHTGSWR